MPRVSLSPDAVGYMTEIGVSAEKGARLTRRAPRAERYRPVAVSVNKRSTLPRANARILRTLFKMLAILACLFVFFAIADSLRAAEGNLSAVPSLAAESASATLNLDPKLTVAVDVGERLATWSGASGNEAATGGWFPGLALGVGMALIAFLLISTLITISAFTVGLIDGAWLLRRFDRHRFGGRDHEQVDPLDQIVRARDAEDETTSGPRPGPTATTCPRWWGLGLASIVGPVRTENQDHAIAWDQGPFRVIVVGDGMGGLPRGKEAATAATRRVARHLAGHIADGSMLDRPLEIIRECFSVAAGALRITTGITGDVTGLRTTLIVVVLTSQAIYWGYIGDGGLWVYRQDGTIDNILTGHKDPDAPNVLFASLGPTVQGYPEIGSTGRCSGDVVFVGSDGVFDRIPDPGEFSASVVDAARDHFNGDLQRTVDEVARQLSEAKDTDGTPICDDNLTLAVAVPDNEAPLPKAHKAREEPAHA
ncbi:MAG: protein phosphatase 2C domain-containing protein [Deltaproteobacteria bacterium]|nr:protein phosphatase 2C domain-containing protein [Deltaproteobacteria bacterium]